jgi:hypothetical protein
VVRASRDKPQDKSGGGQSGSGESDTSKPKGQELVCAARVSLDRTQMQVEDRLVDLTPGMAVTVEIKTGSRRVIEYLLWPLLRYKPNEETNGGHAIFGSDLAIWRRSAVRARRSLVTFAGLACLAPLLLWSGSAHSRTFELIYGKQFALCRAFQNNLAAFPDLSEKTYEWPLDPKLTDFKKPRWRPVDIRQRMDMIRMLHEWNYNPLGDVGEDAPAREKFANSSWERDSHLIPDAIAKGLARLEGTRLDFDHDGTVDTVYRYFHQIPEVLRPQVATRGPTEGYWYVYLDDGADKAFKPFQEYSRWDVLYDSFLYRGRFYLIAWQYGQLRISEPHKFLHGTKASDADFALIEVCRFRPLDEEHTR